MSPWLPAWIGSVGTAVWVTRSDGKIGYLNDRAEELLGRSADECVGQPCYQVIRGTDASGRSCCRPNCPVFNSARTQNNIEPISMRVRSNNGEKHWVDVLYIKLKHPETADTLLVHCALVADRAHRIENYMTRVAARSPHVEINDGNLVRLGLTRREYEILGLLARGETLKSIADKTHVSYTTVRNHVQHILVKLGVHSIMEAVACYLLVKD